MQKPIYIFNKTTARNIDNNAINTYLIPSLILMEHAASEIFKIINDKYDCNNIAIFCGNGNNGGDGLALARILTHHNFKVAIFLFDSDIRSNENQTQLNIIYKLNIPVYYYSDKINLDQYDLIIDAIFGIGLSREIVDPYKTAINHINNLNKTTISIDIASGINADNGKVLGTAIKPDLTIALNSFKYGHFLNDGKIYHQNKLCVDIGIPKKLLKSINLDPTLINEDNIYDIFPKRENISHKGTFGKCLLVGGSTPMMGALQFCALSCLRSGIGTLTIFAPDCLKPYLLTKLPEAMKLFATSKNGYFNDDAVNELAKIINNFDIICIGNGIGRTPTTLKLVKLCLESSKTIVLDADALWALQNNTQLLKRDFETILCPHPREMTYLTNNDIKTITSNYFDISKTFVQKYPNCTLIYKDCPSLIINHKNAFLIDINNSNLAKGGSGDVLAGIITAFCAYNNDILNACASAVYCHKQAGFSIIDPAFFSIEQLINNLNYVYKKYRQIL